MSDYFEGYYLKHQKGEHTLCLIVGKSDGEQFIQVITRDFSGKVPYTEGNIFSKKGVVLDIQTPSVSLTGKIRYGQLSPIQYDIMGPFRFFPMECRHGVISMHHSLEGMVMLNGQRIDFTGGNGYIEMDSGRSFPSSYVWVQSNDFREDCRIMAAVAVIPFLGFKFRGCICVIQYEGKEYRLATYLGARTLCCSRSRIVLKQGKYLLEIRIRNRNGQELKAPKKGGMRRIIMESAACYGEFTFSVKGKQVFHLKSQNVSFEYEGAAVGR